ncbi:hypothetical protein TELCIR_04190 [Teladorsagia circumcincta]|uniref:Phlebovirus glycoprotein G2 fusion domain-containing protein n=1 Tax=Teladorsagia circumcincta TaxID=45464 RepID=A0A2G9UUI1_TELCI|nr:hypothetical protein TELCIR_04190 [Teladorsagia circumcincta]
MRRYSHYPPMATTGTSAFCRRHSCVEADKATLFCTYSTPVTTYEFKNNSVIVHAWGTTTRQYYPYASISSNESKLHFTIPRCAIGGISIDTTEKFNMVEVCSAHVCVYLSDYESETTILLPTSIVIFDYTATVQAWKEGTRKFFHTLKCTGKPICEVIDCIVCWEHLYNYQCWTTTQIVSVVFASLVTLIFCRLLSPLFKCLWWVIPETFRTLKKLMITIFNIIRCRRRKYTFPKFPSYAKRKTERYTRILPITLMAVRLCYACSDVVSFTSTSHNCEFNGTIERCTVDHVATLHLQPIGQELCLLLRDSKDQPAGTISLRLHNVAYHCQQKTQYYTRDHSFHTESNHQCWNTKSCTGETCKGTTTSSKIPELSHYANQRPGFTYCSPSCKCFWCDWCFRCTETCIFYRHYAEPQSTDIYRVFSCPSWPITVQGTITTNMMHQENHHNFVLQPATPHRWNQLQVALTATASPNFPILGNFFVSNGEKTAIVDPSPINQLLPYSIGQLQCDTLEDAKKFDKCRYSPTS